MTCEHGLKATEWSKNMTEERNNGNLHIYKSLEKRE